MFSRFFNINKNIIIIIIIEIIEIIIINIIGIRNKVVGVSSSGVRAFSCSGKAVNIRSGRVMSVDVRNSFVYGGRD